MKLNRSYGHKCGVGFLACMLLFLVSCQGTRKIEVRKLERLTEFNQPVNFFSQPILEGEQVGYILLDAHTGEVLEKQQENQSFIPGSTSKVPTTIAALQILGPQFRFKTDITYTGKIESHRLIGDLYLRGTGDPSLKIAHLIYFAQELVRKGIRQVSGNFYFDDSIFISQDSTEEGRELWAPFNTGVSALSVDFNQLHVRWSTAADRQVRQIYSVPDFPFVQFDVIDRSLSSETNFVHKKEAEKDYWLASQYLPLSGNERLPMKQPALATASLFAKLCEIEGLSLPVPSAQRVPTHAIVLAQHESQPLVELVDGILEYSNNLMAELVQLRAAYQLLGRPTGLLEATATVHRWMNQNALKGAKKPYLFKNGSGLNSENQITPLQLATTLRFADRRDYSGRSYESLLPISGYKGSLSNRLSLPKVALRVRAKTGSMNYINSLVGFVRTKSQRRLIFAIMTRNLKARQRIDQILDPLSDEELNKIEHWHKVARNTQDQLLSQWIAAY